MNLPVTTAIYATGEEFICVVVQHSREGDRVLFRGRYAVDEAEKLVSDCSQWLREGEVRVTLPPFFLHFRLLEIPLKNPRKLSQVLPFEMENEIPLKANEMLTAFEPAGNEKYIVMAAPRELVESFVGELDEKEFFADVVRDGILPLREVIRGKEGCVVNVEKYYTVILCCRDGIVIPRIIRRGVKDESDSSWIHREIRRTIHALPGEGAINSLVLCGSQACKLEVQNIFKNVATDVKTVNSKDFAIQWPYSEEEFVAFFPALAVAMYTQTVNFRTGELAPHFRKGLPVAQLRVFAAFVLASLIALDTGLAIVKRSYRESLQILKAKELNLFVDTFPDVKKILDPYLQMKEMTKKYIERGFDGTNNAFLDIFLAVSRSADASKVQLVEVSFIEGRVEIDGRADEVILVDAFRKRLEEEEMFEDVKVILTRRTRDGSGYRFRIRSKVK